MHLLWPLVKLSFLAPRQAAQGILRWPLGENGRWAAFALMVVVSALLMHLLSAIGPLVGPDGVAIEPPGPFFWAMTVGAGMVILTGIALGVGKLFGGRARLSDVAVLVAWLQFVQLVLAAAQVVLMLALPMLGGVLEIASVLAFLWLLAYFMAEAHGFRSVGWVMGGVLVTFGIMVLLLSALLYPYLGV